MLLDLRQMRQARALGRDPGRRTICRSRRRARPRRLSGGLRSGRRPDAKRPRGEPGFGVWDRRLDGAERPAPGGNSRRRPGTAGGRLPACRSSSGARTPCGPATAPGPTSFPPGGQLSRTTSTRSPGSACRTIADVVGAARRAVAGGQPGSLADQAAARQQLLARQVATELAQSESNAMACAPRIRSGPWPCSRTRGGRSRPPAWSRRSATSSCAAWTARSPTPNK